MNSRLLVSMAILTVGFGGAVRAGVVFSGEKKLNNLVSELLEVSFDSKSGPPFTFTRTSDGWIFISSVFDGKGAARVFLDKESDPVIVHATKGGREAMRHVTKGQHAIRFECDGNVTLDKLEVRAIPELIHCGLGFNPEIKSYGLYDMDFLKADILPNVTTLIVPGNIQLSEPVIADWHRQGKRFVAEVGIDSQSKTAEEHSKYWTGFYDKAPFLDGIIIDEFIVNKPVAEWTELTSERRARMKREREQYVIYGEALKELRADDRYKNKMLYAYFGGSGKKLNQEIIGTNFVRTIIDCGFRVVPERYLHEMSSEQGSRDALQAFVDGITDWGTKEPGVKRQMAIAFGLFSMPPGGLNKQPNVDYHVWMDQQMNVAANHPALSGISGLEWWTSLLADEETVRFVGKLYRHYAIEGRTGRLTSDPLFLTHIQNADFEKGTDAWTLHPAEEGSIAVKRFSRYGRIEGRFMGLGRPADPEHIGDTFLWMKRSEKGPNTFSQTIKDLEPGRLYSMKMFACDYNDLVNPKARKREEATGFIGSVTLEGVEVEAKRSFIEMYSSNPEPKIPVWITYHWKVFRAKGAIAKLTVSDWPDAKKPSDSFGQEQAFNFLEIQPYHE
ncbi:MAG TPA: hypothetical protein VN887_11025 [Candidatus Angelobacter sp.]|nr:hypothetical protein [Candidatus Angelobacter sp.]